MPSRSPASSIAGAEAAAVRVTAVHGIHGVEGTILYTARAPDGTAIEGPDVALVALTHGNEPVGELVFERLQPMLAHELVRGSLLLVRSNLSAAGEGRRHTAAGTDINRLWDAASLERLRQIPSVDRSYEQARVLELAPLLERVDGILDLHSASQPSPPFLVVRDDQRHARLVEALGVQRVVTGLHEDGVLGGGVTPDVGLRLGEGSKRIGMTFEAGQHSDPENRRRAFEVVVRFLSFLDMWRHPLPPAEVKPKIYEVIDAFRQAPADGEPFQFPGYLDGSNTLASGRPLASFQPVSAGEVLLSRGHTVVRAPTPFTMVLPTPTADPDTDMFYVALERGGGPDPSLTRSHAEARREALAIESMLDVLADDELSGGATWASFHDRQVLDLAAELVMRTVRLPVDDPNRRLSLVGRGEWGSGASEARAGRRYRRAVREAIREGVKIDRYQLLQGASLGWLDALTSDGMEGLLKTRRTQRRDRGQRGSGIRMFLSAERPSAVAVLVAGDLERARATNDARHVRVAVIIEAPVVESDASSARVRALRLGLISGRRAFLDLASTLLARLRAEHSALVRQPPLSTSEAIHDAMGPGDALVPPVDRAHLLALGASIRDLQLRLWRDGLRHVVQPRALGPGEVGPWLAETMRASGVLDAEGLHALLVQDGRVVPERLHQPVALAPRRAERSKNRILPPIAASEVDADTLSRWVGWRRFIGGRQIIPDTRGKDVDLMLEEGPIADRISRWVAWARAEGEAHPGQVLVVMAGDGLRPGERKARTGMVEDHTGLLLDPNVAYLRIQHARGSYLRWLKGLVTTLRRRPAEGAPARIRFEEDSGASVNLVLILRADGDVRPPLSASLAGWRPVRCAALVSSLGQRGASRVGVFTESIAGRSANPELLQFGQAHVERFLGQEGAETIDGDAEHAEFLFVERLARWIDRARDLRDSPFPVPEAPSDRARWLKARLGLADPALVKSLVRELERDSPARPTARALWDTVVPWPEI